MLNFLSALPHLQVWGHLCDKSRTKVPVHGLISAQQYQSAQIPISWKLVQLQTNDGLWALRTSFTKYDSLWKKMAQITNGKKEGGGKGTCKFIQEEYTGSLQLLKFINYSKHRNSECLRSHLEKTSCFFTWKFLPFLVLYLRLITEQRIKATNRILQRVLIVFYTFRLSRCAVCRHPQTQTG